MSESKSKLQKGRIWATIIYPESASENWLEELEELKVPCYVSPLHDKDGVKEHYHVLLMFSGSQTRDKVKAVVAHFSGIGTEAVLSKKGYLYYLIHQNNADKAQYDGKDVLALNGAIPYFDALEETEESRYKIMSEIVAWIEEQDKYISFADVISYARKNEPRWFKVLINSNTYMLWHYLKSRNGQM